MNRIVIASVVMVALGVAGAGVRYSSSGNKLANVKAEAIAAKSSLRRSDQMKFTSVNGPLIRFSEDGRKNASACNLVAIKPDGRDVLYFLKLQTIRKPGDGSDLWQSAKDVQGNSFQLAQTFSEKNDNESRTHLGAELSREHFTSALNTGMKWKFIANNGDNNVEIPPQYIAGFLQRVDKEFGGK